ncbi:hypothetical protein AVEN_176643-1 [Araneus ventricosus]|uniref:Uncharacterized protein n=1 Tax=Araneus ventricosus TaxID=182803 RepID=A0A4Y2L1L8_ARAVE|nr:hypothetical protein AVEN_176643-1 [Araneus ventricosus]
MQVSSGTKKTILWPDVFQSRISTSYGLQLKISLHNFKSIQEIKPTLRTEEVNTMQLLVIFHPSKPYPDSNFSLQQICSRLALQICKVTANLSRQECKCEISLQQVNTSFEVTMGRTCSKFSADLHCKLIANYSKNRYTQPGIELATYRMVA